MNSTNKFPTPTTGGETSLSKPQQQAKPRQPLRKAMQGPAGPTGAQGPQGTPGAQGAAGAVGAAGPVGPAPTTAQLRAAFCPTPTNLSSSNAISINYRCSNNPTSAYLPGIAGTPSRYCWCRMETMPFVTVGPNFKGLIGYPGFRCLAFTPGEGRGPE